MHRIDETSTPVLHPRITIKVSAIVHPLFSALTYLTQLHSRNPLHMRLAAHPEHSVARDRLGQRPHLPSQQHRNQPRHVAAGLDG